MKRYLALTLLILGILEAGGHIVASIDHQVAVRCDDNRTVLIDRSEDLYAVDGEYFPSLEKAVAYGCDGRIDP